VLTQVQPITVILADDQGELVSTDALAEARIAEVLSRPLVSSELAAALARCLRRPSMLRT
jgi:hypothetical protein